MAVTSTHTHIHFLNRARPAPAQRRPGTLAVRVDDFLMQPATDPEGRRLLDEDGRPAQVCAGVWCTSRCTGQPLLVRLSTDEEERADGARGVPAGRRGLDELRRALADACPEGRPDLLDPDDRPVWRLDRARPLLDARGAQRASRMPGTQDACAHMRCSWIVPYNGYVDREGAWVRPAENMEFTRPATVNVSLLARRGGAGVGAFGIFADSVREAAAQGEPSFFRACAAAATRVVTAWDEARRADPAARFGSLSVTIWRPEEHCRFDLADSDGDGRQFLQRWLSHPAFGYGEGAHPVTPDCLLRFLNARGELCGSWRVRSWDIVSLPPGPGAAGPGRGGVPTPAGRADRVRRGYVEGVDPDFVRREGVTHVDVLPGFCHAASRGLLQPDAPGRARAVLGQVRNMLYLALSQGRSPLPGPRLNTGCVQAMVTRSPAGWVNGFFPLRDGRSERCAALLMPDGGRREPAASCRAGLEAEEHALTHLAETLAEARRAHDGPAARGDAAAPGAMPA